MRCPNASFFFEIAATRKREVNLRRQDFDDFDSYMIECCQAIQETTISVVHLTELPESFDIAVENGWPPVPSDGLLSVSCVIPSGNKSVRLDQPRDR